MKPYSKYKASGVEWIGDIPEHWNISKLKFHTKKIIDGAHFTPTYIDNKNGVPFLRVTDIHNEFINLDEVKRIPLEEHNELIKRCNPKKGDLLLSKNGTIGLMKIIDWDWEFSTFVSLCLIKFENSLLNKFFLYLFLSDIVDKQLFESSQKTSVSNLHLEKIKELRIILPPLTEQTAIAKFLDRKTAELDTLIANKKSLIELLKEERTAIINHAITKGISGLNHDSLDLLDSKDYENQENQSNPKNHGSDNVRYKDSGIEWIGEIPEHWEVKKLKYCFEIVGGYAFSSSDFQEEGIQLVKIGNLYQNQLQLDRQPTYLPNSFKEKHKEYLANKNDILISLTGTLGKRDYGYAILIENNNELLINQRVAKITTNSLMNIYYSLNMFQSEIYLNELFKIPTGTKQGNFSCEDILSIHMAIPDKVEQDNIANFLETKTTEIDTIISQTEKEIDLLKEYKTALISEVVLGKVDVSSLNHDLLD